ncbi:hypothetical protein D9Q98_004110 [Chlorella vulgaris]|uniref:Protein kinase domain-containing protein n=1 Tax=Chlorella vulgaris TaxID=3077 RepID=A0A9D4TR36_CHLVU|nr:hypothetical protein D9Q98_004110 [Chlorella vulgaris]
MRTVSAATDMLLALLLCASAPCSRAAGRTLAQSTKSAAAVEELGLGKNWTCYEKTTAEYRWLVSPGTGYITISPGDTYRSVNLHTQASAIDREKLEDYLVYVDQTGVEYNQNDVGVKFVGATYTDSGIPGCPGWRVYPSGQQEFYADITCFKPVDQCTVSIESWAYDPSDFDSSVPIGAIVGGVAGGVLLIILAFIAFRRRWLYKKRGITADASSDLDLKQSSGGLECGVADEPASCAKATDGKPGGMVVPVAQGTTAPEARYDTAPSSNTGPTAPSVLPPYIDTTAVPEQSVPNALPVPLSYITTTGDPGIDTFITQSTIGHTPPLGSDDPTQLRSATRSDASALHSRSTDPLLSYIASYMASRPAQPSSNSGGLPSPAVATRNWPADDAPPRGLDSGGSAVTALSATSSSALRADVQQWAVQWSDLQIDRPIGRGSFGWVYLAQWHQTAVAVKVLVNPAEIGAGLELPELTMSELQKESGVMARMRHPNIVSFMGLCALPPCILTEYCSRGSLFELLHKPDAAPHLTWAVRLSMAMDAARGLLYLHSRSPPIIHRDIKSPNLLVDEHWRLKVADFNLSKILSTAQTGSSVNTAGGANNPIWLAPEIVEGGQATAESDVFSFGLVMFELLTWQLPWGNAPHYRIAQMVIGGTRPQVPAREALPGPDLPDAHSFEAYCNLMRECYAQVPTDRPTISHVLTRLRALDSSSA